METVSIQGRKYKFFRPLRGGNGNKFNRALKLAIMFDELDDKLKGFYQNGNGLSLHAICSLAVRLLMHTGIRVGNEGSAEGYMTKPHPYSKAKPEFVKTYGLTTLKLEHVISRKGKVYLNFVGKKQVENSYTLSGDLAGMVLNQVWVKKKSKDILGETIINVTNHELNKFIRKYVGKQFSPKDFRTLRANMEAWHMLNVISKRATPPTKSAFNEEVKEIATHVSECLSNTPGVCKKSYIDDMLFDYHEELRKP